MQDDVDFNYSTINKITLSSELTPPALLRCLRERPLEALLSAPVQAPDFAYAFGPSVDGVVIGRVSCKYNSVLLVDGSLVLFVIHYFRDVS